MEKSERERLNGPNEPLTLGKVILKLFSCAFSFYSFLYCSGGKWTETDMQKLNFSFGSNKKMFSPLVKHVLPNVMRPNHLLILQ